MENPAHSAGYEIVEINSQSRLVAMEISTQIDEIFATGKNVSS
jgi:hypothetical protein